jgi:hypothetical protein
MGDMLGSLGIGGATGGINAGTAEAMGGATGGMDYGAMLQKLSSVMPQVNKTSQSVAPPAYSPLQIQSSQQAGQYQSPLARFMAAQNSQGFDIQPR